MNKLICLVIVAIGLSAVAQVLQNTATGTQLGGSALTSPALTNKNVNSFVLFTNNQVSLSFDSSGIFTLTNWAASGLGGTWSTNGTFKTGGDATMQHMWGTASLYLFSSYANADARSFSNSKLAIDGNLQGFYSASDYGLNFSPATDLHSFTKDAGVYRSASGGVEINTGTLGTLTNLIAKNIIGSGTITATNGFNVGNPATYNVDSSGNVTTAGTITVGGNLGNVWIMPWSRRRSMFFATGSTVSSFGDTFAASTLGTGALSASSPTATQGAYEQFTSGATAGGREGEDGNTIFRTGRNIVWNMAARCTATTGQRIFMGVSDQNCATMTSLDNNVANYAGFLATTNSGAGYSSTAWVCITDDGTTQQTSVTSSSVDTTRHRFTIIFNDSVPNVVFQIDGSTVATITQHLPSASTNCRTTFGVQNTASSACAIQVEYQVTESDL